jgi:hypothetical protein
MNSYYNTTAQCYFDVWYKGKELLLPTHEYSCDLGNGGARVSETGRCLWPVTGVEPSSGGQM